MKKIIFFSFLNLLTHVFISQEYYLNDVTNLLKDTVYSTKDISLINGTVFDHYENGMIKLLIEFESGVKNGEFKKWYSNGQLIFSGNFIKGIKNGIFEEYDIYGKKLSKIKYKEGIILWEKDYSEKYQ